MIGLQKVSVAHKTVPSGAQELVMLWRHESGTRCALWDIGNAFELRIVRENVLVRQQPVTQLLHALYVLAPAWEREFASAQRP